LWRLGRRGSALVEFALVLPAFLLIVMGLVYFSLLVWVHGSLQYAVEDAARCARVRTDICLDAASTANYARARYFGMGRPNFTYTKETCGHQVTATVAAPAADYMPLRLLGVSSSTLRATACFPVPPAGP
jgi:Flp pilus assembly protein TadG